MSRESGRIVKHCVYCGARIFPGQVYCPECGKLIVQAKKSKEIIKHRKIAEKPVYRQPDQYSRTCSGCGSIINSIVLEQCPICNAILEKIPEQIKSSKAVGFIFTNKKLELEKKYIIKKDSWNLKEGFNVFTNSLMLYIAIELFIVMLLWMQIDPNDEGSFTIEMNAFTIIISQIPGIIFGLYAVGYILSNNHEFKKLGLDSDSKKLMIALIIGIIGGLGLLLINLFTNFLSLILYDLGLAFFDIQAYLIEQNNAIKESELIWIIALVVVVSIQAFSTEIVFRGVLHNTLKEKFDNDPQGRIKIIFIVALAYSAIYLLFSFPTGIMFFLLNLFVSLFLGILYEINGNLYNTIIANISYNIFVLIIMLYF